MFNILCLSANRPLVHSSGASRVGLLSSVSAAQHKNEKSASCENVNKPLRLHWFHPRVCVRVLYTHTHTYSALKAVSWVRPSPSFLSVNQCLLTKTPPPVPPSTISTCRGPHLPKQKKINGSSIYRLAGQTTACESQFTGDG